MKWWMVVVALLAVSAHGKEREYAFGGPAPKKVEPPAPVRFAAGSRLGPWTFLELGPYLGAGTFVEPAYFGLAGLGSTLQAGWGVDVGRVQLRPAVHFNYSVLFTQPDAEFGSRLSTSPVALTLAANNLLDDPVTGLRLTPVVGVTVPTMLSGNIPVTTISVALQLERRFGPVEFALRTQVGKPLYVALPTSGFALANVNWRWDNTLLVEGWIVDSFSVGASYAFNTAFTFAVTPVISSSGMPRTSVGVRQLTVGRLFANWAVGRFVGLTFDVETTQTPLTPTGQVRFPFLSFGTWADNATVFSLNLWFRSDVLLQRNWIER